MKELSYLVSLAVVWPSMAIASAQESPVDYVNPFIGTANCGTTSPGAIYPQGMVSAIPFDMMGGKSVGNKIDEDSQWWSTPYEHTNAYFTGFSHVNLSGVGRPELGSLLLIPTIGKLDVDYSQCGSAYRDEKAVPGYCSSILTKYGVKNKVSVTLRTGITHFTFPKGESNILLNLGEGLIDETGATVRFINKHGIEGTKLLDTFCYNPQAVFPIYFVMHIDKVPRARDYWGKMRPMTVEAQWDSTSDKNKLYTAYTKEMSGGDIGAWFTSGAEGGETVGIGMGVSFVSIANARPNLDEGQAGKGSDQIRAEAHSMWENDLSRILIEGGTKE